MTMDLAERRLSMVDMACAPEPGDEPLAVEAERYARATKAIKATADADAIAKAIDPAELAAFSKSKRQTRKRPVVIAAPAPVKVKPPVVARVRQETAEVWATRALAPYDAELWSDINLADFMWPRSVLPHWWPKLLKVSAPKPSAPPADDRTMPWGMHRDKLLSEIPSQYFDWLTRQPWMRTASRRSLMAAILREQARRRVGEPA